MADTGISAVIAQEKAGKLGLHPSQGLGAWLAASGGILAFTAYQTSRLFSLFADEDGRAEAQERIVGPMGLVKRVSNVGAHSRHRRGGEVRIGQLRRRHLPALVAMPRPRLGEAREPHMGTATVVTAKTGTAP